MKTKIVELLRAGNSYAEIVLATGCSKSNITYHAKKLGMAVDKVNLNWSEIQKYYDAGHSVAECASHYGFNPASWFRAAERGDVFAEDRKIPLSDLLTENSPHQRGHVKRRLVTAGLLKHECAECGQGDEWKGKKLVMVLDHKNGVNNDHRIENLRMLCPNCNSQTDTFSGKNIKKK